VKPTRPPRTRERASKISSDLTASERKQSRRAEVVIWHDVECGSYAADLSVWGELAERARGPVLELGAGTGRVALQLARLGHEVTAVDSDPTLLAALEGRARAEGLAVDAEVADVRDFDLGHSFSLVVAPMQLLQILGGAAERSSCLSAVRDHLRPDGIAAFALVERLPLPLDGSRPLPDVREHDGWVYSSLPLAVTKGGSTAIVDRLRQTVSPAGELTEEHDEVRLELTPLAEIEREALVAGLRCIGRRSIPASESHVGSEVLIVEGT